MYNLKDACMDVDNFSGKNTNILTIQYIEGKQCEGSIVQNFALRKCDARQEPLPEVLPASFLLGLLKSFRLWTKITFKLSCTYAVKQNYLWRSLQQ